MYSYQQYRRNDETRRHILLRFWARLLDYLMIKILLLFTQVPFGTESDFWETMTFYVFYTLFSSLFAEGRTIGKIVCGLRVLYRDNTRKTRLWRELCFLICFPFIVLALPFHREQSLHERVSQSSVMHVVG